MSFNAILPQLTLNLYRYDLTSQLESRREDLETVFQTQTQLNAAALKELADAKREEELTRVANKQIRNEEGRVNAVC